MEQSARMLLVDALRVLHGIRRDEIIVSVMGAAREWMKLSDHPLDFNYVPSSMGQGTSLGLGLALAQPERRVIVCNGDGSLLMNLGTLVTISAAGPSNLTLLVFDNGVYEVTGAQPTPGSSRARASGREIDVAEIARACGWDNVYSITNLDTWREQAAAILRQTGPTFVRLKVAPVPGGVGPKSPGPAAERAQRFAESLQNRTLRTAE